MLFKKKLMCCLALGISFLFVPQAHADWRGYVWTYEYMTMAQRTKKIEYYFTTEVPQTSTSNVNTMRHWLELEYGLTDRWDIAGYLQYKQANRKGETDFDYDGFKIRTRYRFGEKDKYLLDPLVYFEYKKDDVGSTPDKLESKIILAKDIGKWNVSYNQVLDQELESSGRSNHGFAFGTNYQLDPRFKAGIEAKGSYTDDKYYVGPTLAWAPGKWWVSSGVVFGLDDRADSVQTRIIVGFPF